MSATASGSEPGPVEITAATLLEAVERGDFALLAEARRQLQALEPAMQRIASDLNLTQRLLEES